MTYNRRRWLIWLCLLTLPLSLTVMILYEGFKQEFPPVWRALTDRYLWRYLFTGKQPNQ